MALRRDTDPRDFGLSEDELRALGFRHGQYLNYARGDAYRGGWEPGDTEPWKLEATNEELPLSNLYLTMLHKLGVETDHFADSTNTLAEV